MARRSALATEWLERGLAVADKIESARIAIQHSLIGIRQGDLECAQAIGNAILLTDEYELITFVPTTINGLSESVTMGESGMASAEIFYADFNLEIPFSQSVDAVEDTVILELAFVALADG